MATNEHGETPIANSRSGRVVSVDMLRGFSMLWIIGGAEVLFAILGLFPSASWTERVTEQFGHVEWEGFHFYDLIFPMFVFVSGVSVPLAISPKLRADVSRGRLAVDATVRAAMLFGLGLVYNGLLALPPAGELRIMGVLQRIALAYLCAALTYLMVPRMRTIVFIIAGLLIAYWALLMFVAVPGVGSGVLEPGLNLSDQIDLQVFNANQMYDPTGDPEGLLSTTGAAATALLGVATGEWIRRRPKSASTAGRLALVGAGIALAGYLWGFELPIIKRIWTSSFVLVGAGWSLVTLAAFYLIADVWRRQKPLTVFLAVIGSNAILIYVGQGIVNFESTTDYLTGGLQQRFATYAVLIFSVTALTLKWIVLWFLDRRRLYLHLGMPRRWLRARPSVEAT